MADKTRAPGDSGTVELTEGSLRAIGGAKFGDVTLKKGIVEAPAGRTDRILSDPSLTVEDRVQ